MIPDFVTSSATMMAKFRNGKIIMQLFTSEGVMLCDQDSLVCSQGHPKTTEFKEQGIAGILR